MWLSSLPSGLYNFVQSLIAGSTKLQFEELVLGGYQQKGPTLDIGCGPKPIFANLPLGALGVDLNFDYLLKYHVEGSSKFMGILASACSLPFHSEAFQEVFSVGLFHHLSDEEVSGALREAVRCLKPGGSMILFDGVWPSRPCRNPLAWLVRALDRGTHMRTEAQLRDLVAVACGDTPKFRRISYSRVGLEGLVIRLSKPERVRRPLIDE